MLKAMQNNPEDLSELMKPELYAKVRESLHRLKLMGYRTKLINQWEGVIEWKLYGYMRYEGISPLVQQNFPYNFYNITQINALRIPLRMEFELDQRYLMSEKEGKELIKYENPFDIRSLPKESKHLHEMLNKYPIYILSADVGILSMCKFHIIDLYSQKAVVEGEKSGDEYEFHLIRYEKVFPKDEERYSKDLDYQRFMDTNFKHEQYNWVMVDVDQYMNHLPIASSS
jgi:hypothetical protein